MVQSGEWMVQGRTAATFDYHSPGPKQPGQLLEHIAILQLPPLCGSDCSRHATQKGCQSTQKQVHLSELTAMRSCTGENV